jgi:hypothetical protein
MKEKGKMAKTTNYTMATCLAIVYGVPVGRYRDYRSTTPTFRAARYDGGGCYLNFAGGSYSMVCTTAYGAKLNSSTDAKVVLPPMYRNSQDV